VTAAPLLVGYATAGGAGWRVFCLVLLAALGLAFAMAFLRLVRGPSLPDRVIAADVLVANGVAAAALLGLTYNLPVLLDVAMALAVVTFIATVAFARYLERIARP